MMSNQKAYVCAICVLLGGCFDGELTSFSERTTSGLGGTESDPPVVPPARAPLLVDDFEDGDTLAANGFGWWYTQNDTTGEQAFSIETVTDEDGGRAAFSSGSGFEVWGALIGLDFTPGEGLYDARSFGGLRLRARVSADSISAVSVRLIENAELQFARDVMLTTEWTEYHFAFSELAPVNDSERAFDAA
ncbi:MAG TPA: hypothetical protein VFU02_22595, partial [Polyangiaceae bacterium]|nr:hypothetical protein [Polyangiaceae bacterium]